MLRIKKLSTFALFLALSQVLGFLEHMIPVFTLLPGGKIGIANIVTMVVFVFFGTKQALFFGILRSFLSAVLFGGMFSFLYSGAGTVFSVLFMAVTQTICRDRVTEVGLSVIGAAAFNAGQILVCMAVLNSVYVVQYLSFLLVISAFAGVITGYLAKGVNRYLKNIKSDKNKNGVIK